MATEEDVANTTNVTERLSVRWTWPQYITTIVAVLSLMGTFFWTMSDFRVVIADLVTRTNIMNARIDDLNKKIIDLDERGSRKLIVTDTILKEVHDQLEKNTVLLERLFGEIIARNNALSEIEKRKIR